MVVQSVVILTPRQLRRQAERLFRESLSAARVNPNPDEADSLLALSARRGLEALAFRAVDSPEAVCVRIERMLVLGDEE